MSRRKAIPCPVPRNISFALTTPQFLDGSKDVTRRVGWLHLVGTEGQILNVVDKVMGFKPGQRPRRLGNIVVTKATRELLSEITPEEVRREGFPGRSARWFIQFFCKSHKGVTPDTEITRIEFRKIGHAR